MSRPAFLLVAVAVLAGCGGGGATLSKAEYAKRADAVCRKYNAKINALGRPTGLADLAIFTSKAVPLVRKADGELRDLRPPQSEAALAKRWNDTNDRVAVAIEHLHDAAKKQDRPAIQRAIHEGDQANRRSNILAHELGMTTCATGN